MGVSVGWLWKQEPSCHSRLDALRLQGPEGTVIRPRASGRCSRAGHRAGPWSRGELRGPRESPGTSPLDSEGLSVPWSLATSSEIHYLYHFLLSISLIFLFPLLSLCLVCSTFSSFLVWELSRIFKPFFFSSIAISAMNFPVSTALVHPTILMFSFLVQNILSLKKFF